MQTSSQSFPQPIAKLFAVNERIDALKSVHYIDYSAIFVVVE